MRSADRLVAAPVQDVLPDLSAAATERIVRAAARLDAHRPSPPGAPAWQWYPDHAVAPAPTASRAVPMLLGTAISVCNTGQDWLELAVDVAWSQPPLLTVSAAVEVACWCPTDHGTHAVRSQEWLVGDGDAAAEAFAAAVDAVVAWLDEPADPNAWRARAGLPNP